MWVILCIKRLFNFVGLGHVTLNSLSLSPLCNNCELMILIHVESILIRYSSNIFKHYTQKSLDFIVKGDLRGALQTMIKTIW